MREAGLDAQPGNEEGLSLSDDTLIVSGRLRGADPASAAAKNNKIGASAGQQGGVPKMSLSHFSSSGKRQLASFTADAQSGRKGATNPKIAAAQNAAIASALAAQNSVNEKLSPDVEAQARAGSDALPARRSSPLPRASRNPPAGRRKLHGGRRRDWPAGEAGQIAGGQA